MTAGEGDTIVDRSKSDDGHLMNEQVLIKLIVTISDSINGDRLIPSISTVLRRWSSGHTVETSPEVGLMVIQGSTTYMNRCNTMRRSQQTRSWRLTSDGEVETSTYVDPRHRSGGRTMMSNFVRSANPLCPVRP